MSNSNISFNQGPLRNTNLQNPTDFDFYLSGSFNVKPNGAIGLPMYNFSLMSNSNHMYLSLTV